jgi:hypothetical protein
MGGVEEIEMSLGEKGVGTGVGGIDLEGTGRSLD